MNDNLTPPWVGETLGDGDVGVRSRASKIALMASTDQYFVTVYQLLCKARKTVYLLGWDLYRDVDLDRLRQAPEHPYPTRLGDLIEAILQANPELEVYALIWDWEPAFYGERPLAYKFKASWTSHPRFHFKLDDVLPPTASHHQKCVIVDDVVASCGGMDLTINRWDTAAHEPDHELRADPDGTPFGPYHDGQVLVEGDAARYIGKVFRYRWERATFEGIDPPPSVVASPWPGNVTPNLEDAPLLFVQTDPLCGDSLHRRESLLHTLEMLRGAKRFIFAENQYLTNPEITKVLREHLRDPDGPEIVFIGPHKNNGVFEKIAMGYHRTLLLRELRAEPFARERLRTYGPLVKSKDGDAQMMVHTKSFVVDDAVLHIGSANWSNRSMWLETELGITLDVRDDERLRDVITQRRHEMMAMYVGTDPATIAAAEEEHGSIIPPIERSYDGIHRLESIPEEDVQELKEFETVIRYADPPEPPSEDEFTQFIASVENVNRNKGVLYWLILVIVLIVLGSLLWHSLDVLELLRGRDVEQFVLSIHGSPLGWLTILSLYIVASILMVPITFLVASTSFIFGGFWGFTYSLLGSLVSAGVFFAVGRRLGAQVFAKYLGGITEKVRSYLSSRELVSVTIIRMLPIAHYHVVNLVCGSLRLRFLDFILGTALGMLPGILAFSILGDTFRDMLEDPSLQDMVVFVGVFAFISSMAWLTQRFLHKPAKEA